MKQQQLIVQLCYFPIRSAQSKITLFIFCITESGQETKDTQFVVSGVILCDESCCNVKCTGFDMNIRLAQSNFLRRGTMIAATLGKNVRPPAPNWSDDYTSRKTQDCRQHIP